MQELAAPTVRRIESARDLDRFIRVPWQLYSDDPHWVPPLLTELRAQLNPRRNPYFEHAEVACFVAERGDKTTGRISAQVCRLAQQSQGQGTGHFGFFECEDNQETAQQLFQAAESWLQQKGMTRVLGPMSLSINDEVGALVDGFHRPPFIMMGHHPPYYDALIQTAGLQKEMDVYAYFLDISQPYSKRIQRIVDQIAGDTNVAVRPIDNRHFRQELRKVLELFQEAWADNWGYVEPTQAEVEHLINSIRRVIDSGAVMLTEVDGEIAGFMVVLPNVNEVIGDLNGKLFPSGWLRLLWCLKFSNCQSVRVPLMGIRKKYQRTRMGATIALSMIDRCRQDFLPKGVTDCEMSWILEDNRAMRSILEASGALPDKTYRVYSKTL